VPPLAAYTESIETALTAEFGSSRPRILIEPGRYMVADAGLLRAEILLISRKSAAERERWVYVDTGIYNGLDETLDERIQYRIRTPRDGGPCGPVILAGPTCDSADILYRRHPYELPLDLAIRRPDRFPVGRCLWGQCRRGGVQRLSPDTKLLHLNRRERLPET
jgi:ornithine decarboxylase